MLRFALFIICLMFIRPLLGQVHEIDSLQKLLQSNKGGIAKADILNDLSFQYYDRNDSIALHYANLALRESQRLQYAKGISYAYLLIGIGHLSTCEFDLAIQNFKQSALVGSNNTAGRIIYNLTLIGNAFREQGKYDSATYYYTKAHTYFNKSEEKDKAVLYKNQAFLNLKLWRNKLALQFLDSASIALQESGTIQLDIWTGYGTAYQNLNQKEKAILYFNKVCEGADQLQDNYHKIKCVLNKVNLAYKNADYSRALQLGLSALKLIELYDYPPQRVEVLTRMGEIYAELSEYAVAGKYLLQALRAAQYYGLQYEIAYIYGELSWINKDQGNLSLALEYISQSEKIRRSIGDDYGVAICHNIRGLIYLLQKKYDLSIQEHQMSKNLRVRMDNKAGVAASIFNISLVYIELNQIDKALQYQLEALAIEEKFADKQSLAISYDFIASIYLRKGNLNQAEYYLKKCKSLAIQTNSKLLLRNNAGYYAQLFEAKGELKKALEYRKLYQSLNDTIFSQTNSGKLAEMQVLYELDKKDQEIKQLNQEKTIQEGRIQLQQAILKQQRFVIGGTIILLILISGFSIIIFRYYRRVRKLNLEVLEQNEEIQAQSEELHEANESLHRLNEQIISKNEEIQKTSEALIEANQNVSNANKSLEQRVENRTIELRQAYKELDTFFYRASHDFRRPLTTFMGLAEVAKITVKDSNALELFSKVNETAHYLDKMLIKLQSISDLGGQELVYKEVFFKEIFENVEDSYRENLKERNIITSYDIRLTKPFYCYPALVKIIFENLFENSIFFSGFESPFIRIKVFEDNDKVILELEDNGEGIPPEYHKRIFDMYFRANERSKGNGLGLYIVNKALEKINGTIELKSQVHIGTTFRLTLQNKIIVNS